MVSCDNEQVPKRFLGCVASLPYYCILRSFMRSVLTEIKNYKDVLTNGLTLITIEMPHIHTQEITMLVRAGLRFENEANNGISHFLEHMIFRGNKKYPDSVSLNKEFEKIGRDVRASTMTEYTFYGFSPHVSQLERGMELFSDFFERRFK